ncbi:MAG: hypothetical protein BroJett004_08260 [Planctomycetota bacterium]|nr:MAG: hypothetical protein BroJett004_08260 [Planctomycetota bacterium]
MTLLNTHVSLILVNGIDRAAPVLRAVTRLGMTVGMPLAHVPFGRDLFARGAIDVHKFVYRAAAAAGATDLPVHLNVEPKAKFLPSVPPQGEQLRNGALDPVWFACAANAIAAALDTSPDRAHSLYKLLRVAPHDLGDRRDEHTRRVNDALMPLLHLVPVVTSAVYCRGQAHNPTADLNDHMLEARRVGVFERWCLQLWGVQSSPDQATPITPAQASAYARFIRESRVPLVHVYAECETPAQAAAEAEGIQRIATALRESE